MECSQLSGADTSFPCDVDHGPRKSLCCETRIATKEALRCGQKEVGLGVWRLGHGLGVPRSSDASPCFGKGICSQEAIYPKTVADTGDTSEGKGSNSCDPTKGEWSSTYIPETDGDRGEGEGPEGGSVKVSSSYKTYQDSRVLEGKVPARKRGQNPRSPGVL